jgi:hypothetical protein
MTVSGGESSCKPMRQSHPRLMVPFTRIPLLDAELGPVPEPALSCDLNIELPIMLKWLEFVRLLMDFLNCGEEDVELAASARAALKVVSHLEKT